MRSDMFYLCLYIYKEHVLADEKLRLKQLDINKYEYSPNPFKETGDRYIGLKEHIKNKRVYFNSAWQKIYKTLCSLQILEEDVNWGGHYKILNFNFNKFFDIEYIEETQMENKKDVKKLKKNIKEVKKNDKKSKSNKTR